MRKHYIDNLRSFTILLLFPVHTFMVWNDFGSGFYIWVAPSKVLSTLIVLVNPWFMPMLFVLAGMSARYALEHRSVKEFVMQRIRKLLLPFILGMLFLVPFQSLYARKYFNGYHGGLWEHWKYFYTHYTDLTGYDGAFTPGHLWFILFLFLVSMISLVVARYFPRDKSDIMVEKMPVGGVFFLFIPVWLMYYVGNFGGFSIGKSLALYLIGYYVLGNDVVTERLAGSIRWLAVLCAVGIFALAVLYYQYSYYGDLWVNYIGWNAILVLIGLGKMFPDVQNGLTEYLKGISYSIYILHQSILVALAYYVVRGCDNMAIQILVICIGSLMLTVPAAQVLRALLNKSKVVI